jgi:hypothetical protein
VIVGILQGTFNLVEANIMIVLGAYIMTGVSATFSWLFGYTLEPGFWPGLAESED